MNPLVDICIPVYNESKHIAAVLSSIQDQTYKNIRVFIQDNASTDETPSICRAISKEDGRFVFRENPLNVGSIENIPRAIHNADSDYVMLRSGNDILERTCIEKMMNKMLSDEKIGLVYSKVKFFDSVRNSEYGIDDSFYFETSCDDLMKSAETVIRKYTYSPSFYGLFRRKITEKCRNFIHQYGLDHIRTCEIALYGNIALIDEPLVRMNANPSWQNMLQMALNQIEDYNRGQPMASGFAPRIQYMPFVHMIWGHLDMFGKAHIDPSLKEPLCAMARDILVARFGAFIDREIQTYGAQVTPTVTAIINGSSPFGPMESGYFLRTVQHDLYRAGLALPRNNTLKDLRRAITDALERTIGN